MKAIFLVLAISVGLSVFGQASPHDTVSNGKATVTYGRPYKKDRVIFGGLEKFGRVWRLGADQATTITFAKDVKFGGKGISAGTYTMFAVPNEKEWTIILNSQLGQWGAFKYEEHKSKDVASVTVPVKNLEKTVEQLTIRFAPDDSMIIEWDKTQVVVPLSF